MTSTGARIVAAAAALKPLGLHLLVSPPDKFVITDKPDDITETARHYSTIEQVEEFIADQRRTGRSEAPDAEAREASARTMLSHAELALTKLADPLRYVIHRASITGITSENLASIADNVIVYTTMSDVEKLISVHPLISPVEFATPLKLIEQGPHVSGLVHYVSHGSPVRADGTQAYASVCRAAIVTEVTEVEVNEQNPAGDGTYRQAVGLMVANPAGQFFNRGVLYDPGTFTGPEREAAFGEPLPLVTCDDLTFEGGTWHWVSA